jgi:nicotinamide riboside transporter PnuC
MVILWIITGAICGLLSLLLRMLGKDYGNFLTGLISWALFACVIALVTRRNRNLLQLIGDSTARSCSLIAKTRAENQPGA